MPLANVRNGHASRNKLSQIIVLRVTMACLTPSHTPTPPSPEREREGCECRLPQQLPVATPSSRPTLPSGAGAFLRAGLNDRMRTGRGGARGGPGGGQGGREGG